MIGFNEVPKREFISLAAVPDRTLEQMYWEMKWEVDAVVEDGKEMAARRNGFERVLHHMKSRGLL